MERYPGLEEGETAVITINHPLGLHLRIGKEVVQVAGRFQATLTAQNLTRPSPVVDARSILQLMQLQARHGHAIQVVALGPDAHSAVDALRQLLESPALPLDTPATNPSAGAGDARPS